MITVIRTVYSKVVLNKLEGNPSMQFSIGCVKERRSKGWRYLSHFEERSLEDRRPLTHEVAGAKVIATIAARWISMRTELSEKVASVEAST